MVLAFAALVALGTASPAASSAACPADDSNAYLSAPERVAFGRVAFVNVSWSSYVQSGRLEYVDSSGEVRLRHELTTGQDWTSLQLPIGFEPGATPVSVRLSYRVSTPWFGLCDYRLEQTVRPFGGLAPDPKFDAYHWISGDGEPRSLILVGRECEELAPGDLRVVFAHHGRRRLLSLRGGDSCAEGLFWSESGRLMPGLRFGTPNDANFGDGALGVGAVGQRKWARTFRVDVFWNGRRVLRRWLRVAHLVFPASRIYESDVDRWYDDCEGGSGGDGQPIHTDAKGRRYCVEPAHTVSDGSVRARPPKRRPP